MFAKVSRVERGQVEMQYTMTSNHAETARRLDHINENASGALRYFRVCVCRVHEEACIQGNHGLHQI